MASKVIRELLTKIGYQVDDKGLDSAIKKTNELKDRTRSLNRELMQLKSSIKVLGKNYKGLNNDLVRQKVETERARTQNIKQRTAIQRLDRATSKLSNTQVRAKATTASLGKQLTSLGAMARSVGYAYTAISGAFGFVMKQTGDIEQAQIAMETMLQSEEKANKLMAELKTLATETPFELKDVFKGTNQLLAYNIGADEMIETLTALGNVASVVGTEKLPNLILAYGQVSTAGKLRGQEVRQFTEAGVPVYEILAKQLDVQKKDIADMVSAGKVSFEDVRAAIQDYANGTGRASGAMAMQSQTLFGRLSNLKDIIAITSAEIGKSFLPVIKDYIKATTDWIAANKELIAVKVTKYFKMAADAFGDFVVIAKSVFTTVKTLAIPLGGLENAVMLLGKALAIVFGAKTLMLIGSFIMKFKMMGNAMLFVQMKAMAIPIAIGAAIVGTMLLIDDFIAWMQGRPSLIGDMFGQYDAEKMSMKNLLGFNPEDLVELFNNFSMDKLNKIFEDMGKSAALFWVKGFKESLSLIGDDILIALGLKEGTEEDKARGAAELKKRAQVRSSDQDLTSAREQKGYGFFGSFVEDMLMGVGIMDNPHQKVGASGQGNSSPTFINNNFNSPITVPEGTTQEQAKHIMGEFKKQFSEEMNKTKSAIPAAAN